MDKILEPNSPHPAGEDEDGPRFEEIDSFTSGEDALPDTKFEFGYYNPENILQRTDESMEEYICRFSKTVVVHAQRDLSLFPNDSFLINGNKKTFSEVLFCGRFSYEVDSLLDYLTKNRDFDSAQSIRSVRTSKSLLLGEVGYVTNYPGKNDIDLDFFNSSKGRGNVILKGRQFLQNAYHDSPLVDNRSYSNTLFSIPNIDNPKALEYLESKIDGKNILVLGGGDSVMDLLTHDNLNPKQVVNVDPFLNAENTHKNKKSNYRSLGLKAEDPSLKKELDGLSPDGYDEVWSLYSVPFYTKTAEEMGRLVENIESLLAPGGTWRIYPYGFPVFNGENNNEPDERVKVFQDSVMRLLDSGNFDVRVIKHRDELGYRTLIIKRKKLKFEYVSDDNL